ncbi:MAG: GGDEF domain-containing protein [Myxococcales bacterium]|nr:MAG: GGDEF domain-containing protein [Myxococcales bacterium]
MVVERRGADDGVRDALEALRLQIDQRVRAEQLCDQLTRLPNEAALLAAIENLNERDQPFWLAFIEVDRFKWINDSFGYQHADVLLQRIAGALVAAEHYFGQPATAFRPHGDEFYLLGAWAGDTDAPALETALDLVRRNIGALRIATDRGAVQCTVSIGWLDSASLTAALSARGAVLTRREIFGSLELAMAEAKWQKDCVIRYSKELQSDPPLSLRSECSSCRSKIQVSAKRSELGDVTAWSCPICRAAVLAPPIPEIEPVPPPRTI